MNFDAVVQEVLGIIKRPDKITDVKREVNAAINFCCNESEFARDLVEVSYPIDNTLYTQNIALSEFPRFRKFFYIKPPTVRYYLEPITPNRIFENCKEAVNSYYVAGDDVVIKTSSLHATLLIGYYRYPSVLSGANTFWLLDASPYMIIDRAAAKVFANMGDDASAKKHEAFFNLAWLSARKDLASGVMP